MYSAGMVLNDVADIDEDRRLRSHRPIPSARISLATARRLGWALLLASLVFALVGGWLGQVASVSSSWTKPGIVAFFLAIAVVAYDFALKRFWVGPIVMGSCRSLNVLLGMSTWPRPDEGVAMLCGFSLSQWALAFAVGVYVVGVSWLARREAESSERRSIVLASAILGLSLCWLAAAPNWFLSALESPPVQRPWLSYGLFAIVVSMIGRRLYLAARAPDSLNVSRAVVLCLFSIILVDAILCVTIGGSIVCGFVVAGLILLSNAFARWAYAT
jgi:4-hydroxybenzoate polyprenyltransferase